MNEPTAYCQGYDAYKSGLGYNTNPYYPDSESDNYESWLNGWSAGSAISWM